MRKFRNRSCRANRASSLVELLVSVAVTLSVMVLLAMIVSSVSNQWTRGSSRFLLNTEAGVALDYLVQDLRSIVRKEDGSEWLHVSKSSAGGTVEDFRMLFLAQPLDGGGKVVTVAYRLAFHDPMRGNEPRPILYRCVFSPEDTIELLGVDDLESAWDSRIEEVVDADWFLAENVIEVKVRFHLRDATGNEVVVECLNEASGRSRLEVDGVPVNASGTTLESATVSLMLLDETGLQVMRNGQISRPEMIARHGHEYVEEVEFSATMGEANYGS